MSRKRHKQHRSPVPKPDEVINPEDVLQELMEARALILAARDKAEPREVTDPDRMTDDVVNQMQAAYMGLMNCEIYEIVPDMVRQIHRIFNAHRTSIPYLDAGMLPAKSGYVFFDKLWPVPISSARNIRSLTWTVTTIPTSNYGLVPAVQVNVIGPHYSTLYGDLLPLGEEYMTEWRKSKHKSMQELGRLVWALWAMLNSELAVSRRVRPEQWPDYKAPRLRNIEHERYRIVTLRRQTDPDAEHGHRDVNWQVQWRVDEHWRHLGKYEGPRHKAIPTSEGDHYVCFTCRARGQEIKITHIGTYTKPKDRSDLPWLRTKETINKLVR